MNKDHILAYTAQDMTPTQIADVLGCSAAYVVEVRQEPWFADALKEEKKKYKQSKEAEATEKKYNDVEDSVLNRMKEDMAFADFKDLIRLTEVLIRRRQNHAPPGGIVFNNQQNNTVVLSIPAVVAPEIVVNERREVIAVGKQTMAPMTIEGVRDLFNGITQQNKADKEEAEKILKNPALITDVPEDF